MTLKMIFAHTIIPSMSELEEFFHYLSWTYVKKKSWILPEDLITINMCLLLSGEGTSPYGDLGVSSLLPQEIFIFSTSEMSFPTFCCKLLRKNLIKTWKNAECIPKTPVVHWYAYSMNPGPVRM